MAQLETDYEELPLTITQVTPSGGEHRFFSLPCGSDVSCSADRLGDGLDIRGNGGYVVLPPSRLVSTADYPYSGEYQWISDHGPKNISMGQAPEWLIRLIKGLPKNRKEVATQCKIKEGSRNSKLTSLAGAMRRAGLDVKPLNAVLQALNKEICEPLLSSSEVLRIAESVAKYNPENGKETTLPSSLLVKPLSLPEFLKQDIESVDYFIPGFLPRQGRLMLSAATNSGKSLFVQNMALAMTTGKMNFLNQAGIKQARVLYLDFEMGDSALKDRFLMMTTEEALEARDLFLKFVCDFDLLNEAHQAQLEIWLGEYKIEVLIIDPIGSAWQGNENEKQEVDRITRYLSTLIAKFGISVVLVHHWRKQKERFKAGGEMAAGSYKWAAWLDYHFTLAGDIHNLTVCCEKARYGSKSKPFLVKFNEESGWFEFLTDYEPKFTETTLKNLFEQAGEVQMTRKKLIAFSKANNGPSVSTIDRLLKNSKYFKIFPGEGKEKVISLLAPNSGQEIFGDNPEED